MYSSGEYHVNSSRSCGAVQACRHSEKGSRTEHGVVVWSRFRFGVAVVRCDCAPSLYDSCGSLEEACRCEERPGPGEHADRDQDCDGPNGHACPTDEPRPSLNRPSPQSCGDPGAENRV